MWTSLSVNSLSRSSRSRSFSRSRAVRAICQSCPVNPVGHPTFSVSACPSRKTGSPLLRDVRLEFQSAFARSVSQRLDAAVIAVAAAIKHQFGYPLGRGRSEEHTSELQSLRHLVCRLLLEKKKKQNK